MGSKSSPDSSPSPAKKRKEKKSNKKGEKRRKKGSKGKEHRSRSRSLKETGAFERVLNNYHSTGMHNKKKSLTRGNVVAFASYGRGCESDRTLFFFQYVCELIFSLIKLNCRTFVCQLSCHITDFACAVSNFFVAASASIIICSFREDLKFLFKLK